MKLLERIRKSIHAHENSVYFGEMQDTARMIENYVKYNQSKSELVESRTEERNDRWTEWYLEIYKLNIESETVYFQIEKEQGEGDKNWNNEMSVVVKEVIPKEITKIIYEEIEQPFIA